MMNWAKQQLANVAGTEEPIYGPSAIQPVTEQTKTTPYTELTRDDLKWRVMDSTNVETQTFYLTADSGHQGMIQVIYSNVAGIRTTAQFNTKIFYPDRSTSHLWSSDPLEQYGFDQSKHNFHARGCSVDLSADGKTYTVKSTTNKKSVVDIKVSRIAPGFVVGKNGTSTFGTNPQKPWGSMRHAFWPRCKVEGTVMTQSGPVDFKGKAMFIHALQGMKPHHAAARWNYVNFQGPTYTAVMMEFTTPPSYGSTTVNAGAIVTDDKIIYAGTDNTAKHTEVKADPDNGWPEPAAVKLTWSDVAVLEGSYGPRLDRVDIMAEVPKFVKQIVASAAGTKPYIYQFLPKLTIKVKDGGQEKTEEGTLFTEATFIT